MILAAGLLVLAGLGLFVGGLATGTTSFYWGCVACCALAAALLVLVRVAPRAPEASDEERREAEDRAARERLAARSAPPPTPPVTRGPTTTPPITVPPVLSERDAAPAQEPEAPTGRHSDRAGAATGETPTAGEPVAAGRSAARSSRQHAGPDSDGGDPAEEEVEFTDLLMVVDMRDQVLVVDEHPRYHLADCRWLRGRATIPLPVAEARSDGFTPCAVCCPDGHLAEIARARRAAQK
ncbi:hypothetical protein [Blastococcus sp. URHD0036]|uniref:hypothetical protein n=1 Tax=Blastococcus sp. URHD0036 TaxID=1380356 RepID=UPI0006901CE3|nr:hypothetical protein [Blastococcus sp. URHD0036]